MNFPKKFFALICLIVLAGLPALASGFAAGIESTINIHRTSADNYFTMSFVGAYRIDVNNRIYFMPEISAGIIHVSPVVQETMMGPEKKAASTRFGGSIGLVGGVRIWRGLEVFTGPKMTITPGVLQYDTLAQMWSFGLGYRIARFEIRASFDLHTTDRAIWHDKKTPDACTVGLRYHF
ncbi:MAG: hypothetical protein K2L16_06330 [Muribaculaceae bacterium]|nr:hypothetical protein [Muribaculaceae bacterium]